MEATNIVGTIHTLNLINIYNIESVKNNSGRRYFFSTGGRISAKSKIETSSQKHTIGLTVDTEADGMFSTGVD
jgi:hypothetical protein